VGRSGTVQKASGSFWIIFLDYQKHLQGRTTMTTQRTLTTARVAASVGRLMAILMGMAIAAPVFAMPPEINGEIVRSIPDANEISGWSHIDNQRVLVSLDAQSSYLLTLKHQCHGLAWAQNVTVTMSNNTIWAGFDSIKADGLACPIERIQKVDPRTMLEIDH